MATPTAFGQRMLPLIPADTAGRDIVLREANMTHLRDGPRAGDLDVILIPWVGPMPRYEHRIIDSEPVVIVQATLSDGRAAELAELAEQPILLVADTFYEAVWDPASALALDLRVLAETLALRQSERSTGAPSGRAVGSDD